jgi:hypothetical protein
MHMTKPVLRWRAFSIMVILLVVPFETVGLFGNPSLYDGARYLVDTLAVVGVAGYGFNRSFGPRMVWRIFAPFFVFFSAVVALSGLPRLTGLQAAPFGVWVVVAVLLSMFIALTWFIALALLRQGGWMRGGASELSASRTRLATFGARSEG